MIKMRKHKKHLLQQENLENKIHLQQSLNTSVNKNTDSKITVQHITLINKIQIMYNECKQNQNTDRVTIAPQVIQS